MKRTNKKLLVILITVSSSLLLSFIAFFKSSYDSEYVKIGAQNYNGEKFVYVSMTRSGERIKAKYFAAKDEYGRSVYSRFTEWSKNKNIVLLCAAAYYTEVGNEKLPSGLTIDNGKLVNKEISDRGSALVIVYATGGIAVSNLKEKNLKMTCDGASITFNLKDSWDRNQFISCAEKQSATVFQQHLLVYRNQLNDFSGANDFKTRIKERRFLAVGKDANGVLKHIIIDYPTQTTLVKGAEKVLNFLKDAYDMKEVTYMVNMDPGAQNVFKLYDKNGNIRNDIQGTIDPKDAVNLLVYYFE